MVYDTAPQDFKLEKNQYKVQYRCPNCGILLLKGVQKGVVALGRGGTCPHCGVRDGNTGVGNFQILKKNPSLDRNQNYI